MKKNNKLVLLIFIGLFMVNYCFAFDWVQLHNQADNLSIEEIRPQIKKPSESISELYTLALVYLSQYKNKQAQDIFAKILEIEPSNLFAKWGKIETLRRQHKCKRCKKDLEQIIAKKPNFAPAYMTLAYLYYVDMKFEKSAKLSYKIIKMGKSRVNKSNYIRALGLFAGAKGMIAYYGGPLSKIINGRAVMAYLKKAKKIDPDSAVVYLGFGSYYLLAPPIFGRNLEKAEKYLEKAIKADPNFANTYVRMAQVYRGQGNLDKYQQYLNKALEIDPKNELALDIKKRKCDFICID